MANNLFGTQVNNFKKVDFITEPGQFSIRGGIIDVYSFADELPFRLEFFDTTIESIRTFDVNSQLSVKTSNKITIIPNTEAKKSTDYQVSILDYLPKSTTVWTKDINYTKDILNDYFNKVSKEHEKKIEDSITQHLLPENIFTNGFEFTSQLNKFSIIDLVRGRPFDILGGGQEDCENK